MIELTHLTATECVSLLKKGEISPRDLIDASVSRMDQVDGQVNALPIRCLDRALKQSGNARSDTVLAGLPIAIKDYNNVGGVRTTFGSPIFSDYVPEHSDATVKQLEASGAVPIAKSNVPEWQVVTHLTQCSEKHAIHGILLSQQEAHPVVLQQRWRVVRFGLPPETIWEAAYVPRRVLME